MHEILNLRKINTMAAIIAVGTGIEQVGQIIICSDHKISATRIRPSKKEAIVTVKEKINEGEIEQLVKVNTCIANQDIRYRTEVIDAQNLKIIIED